jgi:hypothetical protein
VCSTSSSLCEKAGPSNSVNCCWVGFDYAFLDDIGQAVAWLQSRGILRGGVVLIR